MKFTILTAEFAPMLATVMLTADLRGIETPLSSVKLTTADGRLTCRTHKIDASMIVSTSAVEIFADGTAMVSATILNNVIRRVTSESVDIETSGDQMFVTSSTGKSKLFTVSPEKDLPPAADAIGTSIKLKAAGLLRALRRVSFAADDAPTRYAFNSVAVLPGKPCRLACTDGKSMSIDSLDTEWKSDRPALIPEGAVKSVCSVLAAPDGEDVELFIDDRSITIKCCDRQYTTQLIEGNFAPVDDVIPKDTDVNGTVSPADLLSCINKAMVFTSEDSKCVVFNFADKTIELSSRSPSRGEATERTTSNISGSVRIGFDPTYMIPYLKTCDRHTIDVGLSRPNRPMVMRDEKRVFVLMPVNLAV